MEIEVVLEPKDAQLRTWKPQGYAWHVIKNHTIYKDGLIYKLETRLDPSEGDELDLIHEGKAVALITLDDNYLDFVRLANEVSDGAVISITIVLSEKGSRS